MKKTRTNYINEIISEAGYKSYLEIGIADGANFRAIKCDLKLGVDPEVEADGVIKLDADAFFDQNKKKFDVIFIDGLHHADQVEKDILNAWYSVKMGGVIILHDILPFTEEMQIVPRQQTQWTGDVWRAWIGFCKTYGEKIDCTVIPEKYGLGVIKKINYPIEKGFINNEMTYNEYRELSRE